MHQLIPNDYNGIISIKQKGKVIIEKAKGYADLPNKRPNRLDTVFVTASAGKVFTAVGILKLIEQGKLDFSSCIGELFDFDFKQIDPAITVRQLLTHTSGIPDYFDESKGGKYSDVFRNFPSYNIRKNSDFIPLFIDMPMMYPRGEKFHYNQTGYVTLGLIIEAVTGLLFDEYLVSEIFTPCGMDKTRYHEYDRLPANCANVYIYDKDKDEYYTNIYSSGAKGTGDGGAYTTVSDVERFWRNLFDGNIVSKDMLRQMTVPQVPVNCFGYGLWLEKIAGRYLPHFEGCEDGISFISTYDEVEDLLITLISNKGDNVWELDRAILREFYNDVPPHIYYGE
ncbi:MAG: beta-lactamase family protein [Oscillospiraceae bacterium]|nr:beta-lactamase family protein [Oscillospiraceae bacterium]